MVKAGAEKRRLERALVDAAYALTQKHGEGKMSGEELDGHLDYLMVIAALLDALGAIPDLDCMKEQPNIGE